MEKLKRAKMELRTEKKIDQKRKKCSNEDSRDKIQKRNKEDFKLSVKLSRSRKRMSAVKPPRKRLRYLKNVQRKKVEWRKIPRERNCLMRIGKSR